MKKTILSSLAIAAAVVALAAPAPAAYTVLLAGGAEPNQIHISLTEDGRAYVIDSIVALEVGGSICANPEGNPNELVCPAPKIAGFEVNADGGDDRISVSNAVTIPVTMRGGGGRDVLIGGGGPDKLIGGGGDDRLMGGPGDDLLVGGGGDDFMAAGPGRDVVVTGQGRDVVKRSVGRDRVRKRTPRAAG